MDTECIPTDIISLSLINTPLSLHKPLNRESIFQPKGARQHVMPSGLHEQFGCSTSDDEYGCNKVS